MLKLLIFGLLMLVSAFLDFSQKENRTPVILPTGMGKSYNTWNDSFFPPKMRPEKPWKTPQCLNAAPGCGSRNNENNPAKEPASQNSQKTPYYMRWMNINGGGDGC